MTGRLRQLLWLVGGFLAWSVLAVVVVALSTLLV